MLTEYYSSLACVFFFKIVWFFLKLSGKEPIHGNCLYLGWWSSVNCFVYVIFNYLHVAYMYAKTSKKL